MHNIIIATGSRDHPPMLATRRYPQWRSRFLRYIDTRPYGDALRKCILNGPYKPTTALVLVVATTDDSPVIPEHTTVKTPMNILGNVGSYRKVTTRNVESQKRVNDSAYHKEKMLLCKQAEKGVPLQAKQYDWQADTDEEIDEQELEVHHSYMAKIQENDQNDVESDDERIALANLKLDTKFEKYKAFNDHTMYYDKLKRKLNETLGQLAQKDIEIKEGLKLKAYKISMVKEKHGRNDIDKILSMEKQLKFLNGIVYKRSQSIQTIHMMAPKVPTYNGRPTFANPRYLKQAQSELPCLYTFPYDQSTLANRLIPDGEEALVLKRESQSKLNKDLVRLNSDHFSCVTKMLNDVNARTKKPNVVPISTRKPKGHVNKSIATPHKKKVASKSTTQKPKSYYRILYEKTSKAWKWWIEQQHPSALDGNIKLLCNFVEKYLGTVRFGNDQFARILGYEDLVQGNIMINRVDYVEGLNHNLFSVGQFCDADLEVAF
nr:integrase, catalytic region, zinc finger, CCHC-type, peptidase aspartic, catalytic [Tanacetum cinerariifolium]